MKRRKASAILFILIASSIVLAQPPTGTTLTQFTYPLNNTGVIPSSSLSGLPGILDDDCIYRTQTPGGWGAVGRGNNPGKYLTVNFPLAFPNGLIAGCNSGLTLTLSSPQAITNFLPSGGRPAALTQNLSDATGYKNSLAGHTVALMLSVEFDKMNSTFGLSNNLLADAVIASGMFSGWTVQQVLDEANSVLGGCSTVHTPQEMTAIVSEINESFVDGEIHNSSLFICNDTCPTLAFSIDTACLGEPTNIVNQSSNVDLGATYYLDLLNDGTVDFTSLAADLPDDTAILISTAGTFEFSVVVVNTNGCSDTLVGYLAVYSCFGEKKENHFRQDKTPLHLKAYPTAFREQLNFEFRVADDSEVSLELFSISGANIATLFEGKAQSMVLYKESFHPQDMSTGFYIYKLKTNSEVLVERVLHSK